MTGCRPDEHCFVNTPLNTLNTKVLPMSRTIEFYTLEISTGRW